jgi:hypothetical protein
MVELYLHSQIRSHGVVLNTLYTGSNLPLPQDCDHEIYFVLALHFIAREKMLFESIISRCSCHIYLTTIVTSGRRKYGYIIYQFSGQSVDLSINVNWLKYNIHIPPRGLPFYHGEKVYASQWRGQLCWRDRKFLVRSPTRDRSKGRGQTKCSPWSSRFWVRRGANDCTPRKIYCYETMEEAKTHTGL